MKRSVAPLLVVGYLLLVPYCFFGASVFTPAHALDVTSHLSGSPVMGGHGMSTDACVGCGAGVPAGDADHAGMYLSVTSVTGMPLLSLLLSLTTLLAAVFVFSYRAITPMLVPAVLGARKERRRLRSTTQHHLLSWLSLTETSPTFV